MAGASKIIAVDVNPAKFDVAKKLGATDCVNPKDIGDSKSVQQYIVGTMTQWGCDYTFDCTGNVDVMRSALECAHRGWGVRYVQIDLCTMHENNKHFFGSICFVSVDACCRR